MKLLFVFCCLSAGCIIWTEASPFFFNIQKAITPQRTQIRRPVQRVVSQRTNYGVRGGGGGGIGAGGIFSKWGLLPMITFNFGTRRPKATQRPVIQPTTDFAPSAQKVEEGSTTTEVPAEKIGVVFEKRVSVVQEDQEDDTDTEENTSSTSTTTTEEPSDDNENNDEDSSTTTTTTELPFEESETSTKSSVFTTTEDSEQSNDDEVQITKTESRFDDTEDLTETKTSTTTTTEIPFNEIGFDKEEEEDEDENENDSNTTELDLKDIGFTTERDIPLSTASSEVIQSNALPEGSSKTQVDNITPTTYRPTYVPTVPTNAPTPKNVISTGGVVNPASIGSRTTATDSLKETPTQVIRTGGVVNSGSAVSTTTTNGSLKETPAQIISTAGVVNPASVVSTTTTNGSWKVTPINTVTTQVVSKPAAGDNDDDDFYTTGEVISQTSYEIPTSVVSTGGVVNPSTYVVTASKNTPTNIITNSGYVNPTYVRTTTTNPPWKETPANLINTGGYVQPNKTPDSYVYVRPDISVDDILLNEVSPRARPFETLSVIGVTGNGNRVERVYKPEAKREIDDRPRVTFYSNY